MESDVPAENQIIQSITLLNIEPADVDEIPAAVLK